MRFIILLHLPELLDQLADLGGLHARAPGDAGPAGLVDEVGVAPLLRWSSTG